MVLDACPALADWTPAPIRDWPELIRAATVVRSALGVSPSAWEDAVAAMGEPEAAVCVMAILQRAGFHDATVLRKFGDVPDDLSAF